MGNILHPQQKRHKIILGGLDAAGQTTLLYKYKLNEDIYPNPTVGFNVETLEVKGSQLIVWDLGGGHKLRPLFKHYFQEIKALIYVISLEDQQRLDQTMDDLLEIFLQFIDVKIPILIFANKADIQKVPINQLEAKVKIVAAGRNYTIKACSATQGVGLKQGFQWVAEMVNTKKQFEHDSSDKTNNLYTLQVLDQYRQF